MSHQDTSADLHMAVSVECAIIASDFHRLSVCHQAAVLGAIGEFGSQYALNVCPCLVSSIRTYP